jgi:small subunit ribosomal protein S6
LRQYEMVLLLSPEVPQEEVPAFMERLGSFVTDRVGGSITEVNEWGVRRLAYPIKKFSEGTYVLTRLEMEPASVRELEASLLLSEDVLRHLVVRKDG